MILLSDSGADTLTGGVGIDTFVFSAATENFGNDLVTDFQDLVDNHLSNDADGNAVITIDADNIITLFGVEENDLTAGDFDFVA